MLWRRQVCDDSVVVAGPDAVDRLIEESVAVQHLQQRPMSPGSHEHIVDAAGDGGCHFTQTHERVLRCERQAWVCGPCGLPRVLIANAHSVDGSLPAPEQHARRLRGGVEIAEDNRGPVPRMFLNRERGATGLLLALHLQWKRPIRFVVRNDQWTDSRFQLDNQGGAPWEVLTVFSGALIDLLQHSMLCTSSKRCSSVVLTSGGEGSDAVIQPKEILDPTPDVDFLQRNHVRFKGTQRATDHPTSPLPVRISGTEHVESHTPEANGLCGHR